jgi:aldose 1-epimerase
LGLPSPRNGIFLRDGDVTVGVSPDCGGALTRFDVRRRNSVVDILRPAIEQAPSIRCSLGSSCFPLVPYGGRLREGRFEFDQRRFQFPLNALPERHSSHGDGWQRPWQLDHLDRRSAVMTLDADDSAPFQYHCSQAITVSSDGLRIELTCRNLSPHRIPMGFGLHPYFANRSEALIRARLPSRWQWDDEMMPVRQEANPYEHRFTHGQRVSDLPATAEYADWSGDATIEWPGSRVRVTLTTHPPLHHVVMWMPPGEDFFCFEPVSHATDALNTHLMKDLTSQYALLKPDATAQQRFDFAVASDELPA